MENLLQELANNTYVMLRPSPVDGIGVFAIRDIPKGCRNMFSPPGKDDDWIVVPKTAIENLPAASRHLVETYCLFDADNYFVPKDGFKKMDLVYFLNHSDEPNTCSVNDGEYFETLRDIKAGEELLINYGDIVQE
ncbi:MAG TPA: SET domain-containing protein-lysine N-methyltransferase [Ferruginibacter sp.]|nr:SET domain-containing protein-lysine N-methyltransferase [Ferruginibacter sp.]HMP20123.1 SET domain-containing protein-lysine N-methyltransferase [Ferruginibacter sp.]